MRIVSAFVVLVWVAACGSEGDDDAAATSGGPAGVDGGGAGSSSGAGGGSSGASSGGGGASSGGPDGAAPDPFNNCLRPYAADSPWNTRPVNPVLGTAQIPDSINGWRPVISDGVGYSTGAFCATEADPPVVVHGPGAGDIQDKDVEHHFPSLTIPHWPAGVTPATESDGHADILDAATKIVHSFNGLTKDADGTWHARDYGWSRLDGRGWGDPAHYFQGARATGVPASAGIVRKHEFLSVDPVYRHALSLSLPHNAIKKGDGDVPTVFVYPATAGDSKDNSLANSGEIPEGSLLMLPAAFDVASMPTPELQRIAETLKTYGAYVTDRNSATPFNIYVEIGTGYSLGGSGANIDAALATLQHALRPLASADSWLDGNGQPAVREPALELQSMRGKWSAGGEALEYSAYDTWKQAVVLATAGQTLTSGWDNRRVPGRAPVAGKAYRLTVESTGGGTLRYQVPCKAPDAAGSLDSGALANGQTYDLVWPVGNCTPFLTAKGVDAGATVRGHLLQTGQ